jgi:hypothetical protein
MPQVVQPVRPDCQPSAGGQRVQYALAQSSGGGSEDDCLARDRVDDSHQCFHRCLHAGDEIGSAGQCPPEQIFGVRVVFRC